MKSVNLIVIYHSQECHSSDHSKNKRFSTKKYIESIRRKGENPEGFTKIQPDWGGQEKVVFNVRLCTESESKWC